MSPPQVTQPADAFIGRRDELEAIEMLFEPSAKPPDDGDRKPFLDEIVARRVVDMIRGGPSPSDAVVARLGPDAAWLQLPGDDERIDLAKRPVLQRIVRELVAAHRDGRTVPSAEMIDAVWPDDRSERRSIENRLWVAMSALRRLGLADVIRKESTGYCLDPDLTLEDAS